MTAPNLTLVVELGINVLSQPVLSMQVVCHPTQPMNVQGVMEAAYTQAPQAQQNVLRFSAQYFGPDLGYEMTVLDGIQIQSGADGHQFLFWELLIDGMISTTGMDHTFPGELAAVEWNFTTYEDERHAATRYEQLRAALAPA